MNRQLLVLRWEERLRRSQLAHHEAGRHYERRHKQIGIPVVIVSAVVGSAVFGTLGNSDQTAIQIVAGSLSLLVVILSSLQTFLAYSELSSRHIASATRYSALFRELQSRRSIESLELDYVEDFRKRWDEVDLDAPSLRKSVLREIEEDVEKVSLDAEHLSFASTEDRDHGSVKLPNADQQAVGDTHDKGMQRTREDAGC